MKKIIIICFLVVIPLVSFGMGIYQVETFDSYPRGYDLSQKYEIFYDTDCSLTATIISNGIAELNYKIPNGRWGTGIKFSFPSVIDLTKYEFIRVYFKGDGSKNNIKLQLEEDDYSGNSDGEVYVTSERSLDDTNWGYVDFSLNDCSLVDWSKAGGIFSKSRIKTIQFLIAKGDSSIVNSTIYLNDIVLIPYLIYDYFPDNNVIIDSTDFTMELKLNLFPDIYSLNFIKVKNLSNNTEVPVNIDYNSKENSIEIKNAVLIKGCEYKIIVPPIVKYKYSIYSNISYSTNFEISFKIGDYILDSSPKKFQFLNRTVLSFETNSVSTPVTISGDDYIYTSNERYLKNIGNGIELFPYTLSLVKPARLILYYDTDNNYTDLNIYKQDNNVWIKIGGEIDSIRKRLCANIVSFGKYYIFDDDLTSPDRLFNLKISSKLFTPNNDGVNDVLNIVFYLNKDNMEVSIYVYDINGTKIKVLEEDKKLNAGYNKCEWDGKNEIGQCVDNGIYFIKVKVKDESGQIMKLIKTVGVRK